MQLQAVLGNRAEGVAGGMRSSSRV